MGGAVADTWRRDGPTLMLTGGYYRDVGRG